MDGREIDGEMPTFSIDAYRKILSRLQESGFSCRPVSAMPDMVDGSAYIRHDIDFFLDPALPMAECEAQLGVSATYFVLLTGRYNPQAPHAVAILQRLVALGHEIGLHYDLETYPVDPIAARRRLESEVAQLETLCRRPVSTISMHQPGLADGDPFVTTDRWTHPHDPRHAEGLLYVSDSCRAWRDDELLTCFGPQPPRRLLWLTHPELYLDGSVEDREEYLDRVLTPAALKRTRHYFDRKVRDLWHRSEAAKLDRARVSRSQADADR